MDLVQTVRSFADTPYLALAVYLAIVAGIALITSRRGIFRPGFELVLIVTMASFATRSPENLSHSAMAYAWYFMSLVHLALIYRYYHTAQSTSTYSVADSAMVAYSFTHMAASAAIVSTLLFRYWDQYHMADIALASAVVVFWNIAFAMMSHTIRLTLKVEKPQHTRPAETGSTNPISPIDK